MRRSRTSATTIAARQRRAEILALRLQGRSYAEIGAAVGVSRQVANRHVMRALADRARDIQDKTEELRALEAERLDALSLALWDRATDAESPNLAAIDRILRIMDRRAKLFGLDAPQKVAPTNPEGIDAYKTEETARYVYFLPQPAQTEEEWLAMHSSVAAAPAEVD